MGREYNPAIDRVMKTWDGIGTYMKRYWYENKGYLRKL
jgi:hypothetical protein